MHTHNYHPPMAGSPIGARDEGEIAVYPCRLLLPFYYPATIDELDVSRSKHFSFPEYSWGLRWQPIPEFAEQCLTSSEVLEDPEFIRRSIHHRNMRVQELRKACALFDPELTIFGIESDSEVWSEANTFHIGGPKIPSPPDPVSDIQILARLCHHTNSYVSKSRFQIENQAIVEVAFDGASTTDATIDLLRGIPRLGELFRSLRKISLERTLVTSRSLKFLKRTLPQIELTYSHYLNG